MLNSLLQKIVCTWGLMGLMLQSVPVPAQELSLDQVRTGFSKAVQEEYSCNALHNCLANNPDTTDAVWMAYHGTVTVTMAKFTPNPFRKYQYFTEGKQLIEKSIKKDPENIELRFLRFTVQDQSPSFLGYNTDLSNNKKYILDNLEKLPPQRLKKAIINYISISDKFSPTEKKWAVKLGAT